MDLYGSWLDFRNRCLTSPRFQAFARRFPLTRPIVRKRQSELFDVVSGFVYSQILLVCVELDVFEHIGTGLSIDALADRIDLGVDETRRLAEAAASLRLLQRHNGIYRLGDLGAALVANPGVAAMIRHHAALYSDLGDPVDLLRSGRGETHVSRYWDYARRLDPSQSGAVEVRDYSELMAQSQIMVATEVIATVDFSRHEKLLDVGGGHGVFLQEVARHRPDLQLQLFDLPAVTQQAKNRFQEEGLADRVELFSGSFFCDPLPRGADLISLVRIIHDHDDEPATAILKAVHDALPDDGKLIVCEPMSAGGSARRISDAYFNFYLYAMGSGRPRSPDRLAMMLEAAGFERIIRLPTRFPLITSIISARKPGNV